MTRPPILYVNEVTYPIMAAFGISGSHPCKRPKGYTCLFSSLTFILVPKEFFQVMQHSILECCANILTAAILYQEKCGLSRGITRYMMAMAISALLVIFWHVLLREIYIYYHPNSLLSLSTVCPFNIYLRIVTLDYSVWLTVSFTFDRFVSICYPRLSLRCCTHRTAIVVIVSLCALSCLKYLPFYFMYEPRYILYSVNWGCQPKAAYFTSDWWVIFSWMCTISVSFLPFVLILVLNGLTVKNIVAANRVRRHLKGLEVKDIEGENRRKSIVLLFTVSGTYILLWTTETAAFICTRITVNFVGGDLTSPSYIANEVGVLLMLLNSCVNTCIYALTQRKFREEVKITLKHVAQFICKCQKISSQWA
ncbi:probable G-protein coupled receptor 139 [Hypanus sabinus]|uniref:probable G-protein coupled receptor 139 n=1 Tax=Hypanus sabinus TaxID=79690 RepID=UPI0028C419B3|nr:probable G-protein coupled receptor 139 [Hypanus sabinus]